MEPVPRRQAGAGEGGSLDKVQVGGHGDEALFVEGAVLAKRAVERAAETGLEGNVVERAANVAGIEECNDIVAHLEAPGLLSHRHDGAGAI